MKTNNKFAVYILLFIIFSVASILRLWDLGGNPPGLTPDEASLGYNAYSILKTGRDEYGQVLPLIFKSFGDYKPGLYVYLTIPSVAVFGLTEFAVRLPSAVFGLITVILLYKVCFEIGRWKLAIFAAGLAALNPWLVTFSRGAWEANVGLTLTLAGVYFFLRSLKKPVSLIHSAVFFALTLLTYQGAKLSTALIVMVLVLVYLKDILKFPRKVLIYAGLVGLVISLPAIFSLFQGKVGRLEVFSIFSYPRPIQYTQAFLDEGGEEVDDLTYYLFHSESFNFVRGVAGRWFNNFSGKYLFFEGDYSNPRHSPPNTGVLLHFDLVLVLFGFVYLARTKGKFKVFVLLWLFFSPLPAALSRDQINAVRSLNMVVPMLVLSALGLVFAVEKLQGLPKSKVVFSLLFIFFCLNFVYFLDAYFIHQPFHNAKYWYYGYKQIVGKVWPAKDNYTKVIVQQGYNQPYIYFLFYTQFDPANYQKQAKLVVAGPDVGLVPRVDDIDFVDLNLPDLRNQANYLIVAEYAKVPDEVIKGIPEFSLVDEIIYPNGETAFRLLETK